MGQSRVRRSGPWANRGTIVLVVVVLFAALLPGLGTVVDAAPVAAGAALSPVNGAVQESFSLVSDSGGTVPAAGDTVSMLFDGAHTVWLLLTSSGGNLSFSGSYTYSGTKMTLTFTAGGFSRHGSFEFSPGQTTVTMPFQTLSTKAGTSKWGAQPVDPIGGAMAVAIATVSASTSGVTAPTIIQAAANYISAATGAPIVQSPQFNALERTDARLPKPPLRNLAPLRSFITYGRPIGFGHLTPAAQVTPAARLAPARFNPLVDSISELPDDIGLETTFGASVDMPLLTELATPGSTGEALKPDGTFSGTPFINESLHSPRVAKSDPTHKTALFFLPFQGAKKNDTFNYTWSVNNDGYLMSTSVQKFFDPNISTEASLLQQDGYGAPQILTGTEATVFALIKALKAEPGVVYYESHGGPDGSVLTGDFLGNTLAASEVNFKKLQAQLVGMGAPKDAVSEAAPPLAISTPTHTSMYLELLPPFWVWLHDGEGVDLTHSLFYMSTCDSDYAPALAGSIGARALFAYDVDVAEPFSNEVGLYIISMLTKKSWTAEEVYYNMLLIDETGTTVYDQDAGFNGVFQQQQKVLSEATPNPEDRKRSTIGIQANQPKSDIYNVLDAYGTQTYGDPVPYIGDGWLTNSSQVQGGAIFYLLVAARQGGASGGSVKKGLSNLKICWNAWWSKDKLPGISSPYCQQAAPGYPPTPDEYWYARYLLSGTQSGFGGTYVPRFTLNDGGSQVVDLGRPTY